MTRKRALWRLFLFLPLALVLQGGSCGGDETDNPLAVGEEFRASITLFAYETTTGGIAEGECLHMFAPGEDFPCCQVCRQPGTTTTFRQTFQNLQRGHSYVFRAGRNGVELGVRTCTVSTRDIDFLQVHWIGPTMECGAGFETS